MLSVADMSLLVFLYEIYKNNIIPYRATSNYKQNALRLEQACLLYDTEGGYAITLKGEEAVGFWYDYNSDEWSKRALETLVGRIVDKPAGM